MTLAPPVMYCFSSDSGISKCLRNKRWVDETPFEAIGTNEAKVEAPRRARQNAVKQVRSKHVDKHKEHVIPLSLTFPLNQ